MCSVSSVSVNSARLAAAGVSAAFFCKLLLLYLLQLARWLLQQSSHVPAVSKQGHPERKGKKTDSLVLKHNIHHIQALDNNKIILYTTPEGNIKIEVIFDEESFWLNQKRMADLFGADVRTINEHLQNIYKSGELQKEATIRNIRIVQKEGSRKISAIDNFMY